MRSCWKSDPHIETQSVNNCTYGLPWKGLPLGFMCRYHSGFDRVKWNQHLGGRPKDFHKEIFLYLLYFCVTAFVMKDCDHSVHTEEYLWPAMKSLESQTTENKTMRGGREDGKYFVMKLDEAHSGCSEECFGPSQTGTPHQTVLSHGHVSVKLPICHMGIFFGLLESSLTPIIHWGLGK